MADRATQTLLEGLSRAVADPAGLPLVGGKAALFAATAAGRQAAQRARDEGLVRVVGADVQGRTPVETVALTEKGLAYLLSQASPREVLEDFIRTLEARQAQAGELLDAARRMTAGLDALRAASERVLSRLAAPPGASDVWPDDAVSYVARRAGTQDCPLPELFRHVHGVNPSLTVGRFHDGLRRLHEEGRLALQPWTGPLYDLPEPHYALLVGHEIAYYASARAA